MGDKRIFKLHLQVCIKDNISALCQWVETTEYIFQKNLEANEKTKIKWFFPLLNEQWKAIAADRRNQKEEIKQSTTINSNEITML